MKKKFNQAFLIDIQTYLEVCELAKKHGKKTGDSMQEEFEEVLKKGKDKVKYLGVTDMDIDLLAGNIREQGKKVLNFNELKRKKKNG